MYFLDKRGKLKYKSYSIFTAFLFVSLWRIYKSYLSTCINVEELTVTSLTNDVIHNVTLIRKGVYMYYISIKVKQNMYQLCIQNNDYQLQCRCEYRQTSIRPLGKTYTLNKTKLKARKLNYFTMLIQEQLMTSEAKASH